MPQGCTVFKDILRYNIKVLFSSFISVLYCANALAAVMMLPFNNKMALFFASHRLHVNCVKINKQH